MKILSSLVLGLSIASPALAQSPVQSAEARQLHRQIDMMERVLEAAVAHGAAAIRDRLQAVAPGAPAELLILDSPRVRGFKLDPYGVFFDVEVPSLNGTLTWSLKTLDQNDLSLQSALNTLRSRIDPADSELQLALQRLALQVNPTVASPTSVSAPAPTRTATPTLPNTRRAPAGNPDRSVSATSLAPASKAASAAPQEGASQTEPAQPQDRILENPNEAYRTEVIQALADAMLDFSGALPVGDGEWLTIAARGVYDRPLVGPAATDAPTIMIRARGADLAAFHARQISREEVMTRIEKRVF
jgi:hypothetical protein